MTWVDVLGLFGAFLSSVTFVPQVYKAWKTKSTGDLSVWMILILMANVSTWLTYGIIKNDLAIILARTLAAARHQRAPAGGRHPTNPPPPR